MAMGSLTPSEKTIVLISGANTGIGFEIAKKLATEHPTYHVLMGSRSLSKAQTAISSLPTGLSIQPLELDVTSDASIQAAYDAVASEHGRLDVLINNAGIANRAVHPDATFRQELTQIIDTNAISAACLTEIFIPLLRKSSNPRIVFITSRLGSITRTFDINHANYGLDQPAYKTSKAAMNMIMAHYAVKFKGEGFKVNACCPGYCATNLNAGNGTNDVSTGAFNACRLATAGKDGETGTFTDAEAPYPATDKEGSYPF
jgi:NAD(P)-dependent dehydrogenase (short-subunit alcohol dehydrogenase family)